MKKILLLLSVITLTVTSCSKNDEPTPAVVDAPIASLPKKIIEISNSPDGNSEINLVYNGNKIVEISNGSTAEPNKSVYTYTGDLITKIEYFDNNLLESVDEFVYADGKLATRFSLEYRTSNNITTVIKNKSIFNYNGNVITEQKYTFLNNAYVLIPDTNIYTYANGNLITEINNRINVFNSNTNITKSTYSYEYDSKNSPFQNILGLSKTGFSEEVSVNNVVKRTTSYESSYNGIPNPTQPQQVRNFTNSYNATNFLTEAKFDFIFYLNTNPPTTETRTNTTKYIY